MAKVTSQVTTANNTDLLLIQHADNTFSEMSISDMKNMLLPTQTLAASSNTTLAYTGSAKVINGMSYTASLPGTYLISAQVSASQSNTQSRALIYVDIAGTLQDHTITALCDSNTANQIMSTHMNTIVRTTAPNQVISLFINPKSTTVTVRNGTNENTALRVISLI